MKKTLLTLILAVVLLIGTAPVYAMQPDGSPRTSPAPQTTLAGTNAAYTCGYREPHAALLDLTTQAQWIDWIEKLSGAELVTVGGVQRTINNRHSFALFNRTETDYAVSYGFDYLEETVRAWEPKVQVEVHSYSPLGTMFSTSIWKNLIVTIPGTKRSDEVVLLTAHFDSTNGPASFIPMAGTVAPGAEDNASGSASLLEAARILKDAPLDRTVRLIWFTGEEQGLRGSGVYTNDHDLTNVVGVINLDMFGYDSDNDGCFELHVSNGGYNPTSVAPSERIGACFTEVINAYDLPLLYDFYSGNAVPNSDHSNFWLKGIGAIEVLENYSSTSIPDGCNNGDMNPNYHKATDTVGTINAASGFAIHKAALATLFSMASFPDPALLVHKLYLPNMNHQQ